MWAVTGASYHPTMATTRSADGTTLAFDRHGDASGPPLVLVAGATCTRHVLAPLAEALAPHSTAVTYDRRGRGDSDDLSSPPPFRVEREIEDLAALVEAVGGPVDLYGHSSGAALAAHAVAAGVPVRRLVLHDAPYNAPGGESDSVRWDAELHALLAAGRLGDAVTAFLALVGMPDEMVTGMRAGPAWPAMEAIAPTLAYDSAAMGDREGGVVPVGLLAGVAVPTLVLVGGADHGFMVDVARRMVDALPDARFEQMVGASHDAGPDVVVPRLLPFLRG